MAGIKKLRKIQLGRETTAGTNTAATTVWRGTGTIQDNRVTEFPEEDVGLLPGTDRSYVPKKEAGLTLDDTPATFEQFLHICEMGVETDAVVSQDGAGSGYIFNYAFPTTAGKTLKTYSVEGGDNQAQEELDYTFASAFSLSGVAGESLMMGAELIGREVSTAEFTSTASSALPSVEEILFGKGKLYIDDDTGTMGTTQKTSTFLEMALNVNTGWKPVYTGDGNLYFTFNKCVGPEITLDVTFEHDATGVIEIGKWRAEGGRLIRLAFEGSAFTTAGTFPRAR